MTRMTTNQKEFAKALQNGGFTRRDAKIYAVRTSDFMFQAGVATCASIISSATIGAFKICVAKPIGFGVGKAVDAARGCIEKHQIEKYQKAGASPQTARRMSIAERRAAKEAAKIREEARNVQEVADVAPDAETVEETLAE